jgi:hypothetical protein
MKIRLVLADTGRVVGAAASLLNAGWTATTAIVVPGGGWTLPGQALAAFLEAPWDQLNKPHLLKLELVDDEGKVVQLAAQEGVDREALITYPVIVQPVPGAPNGTPGYATVLVDLTAGTLRIPAPRHRYIWRAVIEDDPEGTDEIGFWVNAPAQQPTIGGFNPIIPG